MNVELDKTEYFVSNDSLQKLAKFLDKRNYSSTFILVDTNTNRFCYPVLKNYFSKAKEYDIISVTPGEDNKSIKVCEKIWEHLLLSNADRNSVLINLGGGIISDIGGFVASTFKRGIDYVNIPTTLLSMIDASIGGKTAINFESFKNQIGTFYGPETVVIYRDFLKTLEDSQLTSGFGEIIKYALIDSKQLWEEITSDIFKLDKISDEVIKQCIQVKMKYVEEDPFEMSKRKLLNFGHTVAHALETLYLAEYDKELMHGHAVAIGIIIESLISTEILGMKSTELNEIIQLILRYYDKISFSEDQINNLIHIMYKDKKNVNNSINFTLLKSISSAKIDNYIPMPVIKNALVEYLKL